MNESTCLQTEENRGSTLNYITTIHDNLFLVAFSESYVWQLSFSPIFGDDSDTPLREYEFVVSLLVDQIGLTKLSFIKLRNMHPTSKVTTIYIDGK